MHDHSLFWHGTERIVFVLTPISFVGVHVLFMLFVRYSSNTTGVACGAGTANPYEASEFTPNFSGFLLLDLQFFALCFVDRSLSFELCISCSCSTCDARRVTVNRHKHNLIRRSCWTPVYVNKYK